MTAWVCCVKIKVSGVLIPRYLLFEYFFMNLRGLHKIIYTLYNAVVFRLAMQYGFSILLQLMDMK